MWRRLAVLGALALAPAMAWAYDGFYAYGGYAYEAGGGYRLSLPQTLRGTVAVPLARPPGRAADTLAELYPVLAACWHPPAGLGRPAAGSDDVEITARLSLRRDGSLIGTPRITYAAGFAEGQRRDLVRATLDALAGCMPARITPGLGRAIAGRPVALRLVYRPPA
ncbi:hypothetical protein [Methylobacterium pseudosasicola]|uniref:Uncharacterized protein n=1 Tax=Methylobacterium pseudosasicola TaxID=582667 RepID=A0A1I4NCG7_9HYPH|nr:hypothetical protein [Methylobacterium pseudosasicola]SFM13066.1 hypothetical protein SAMN05192568_102043 [Methylobacterium pseudosasicola]